VEGIVSEGKVTKIFFLCCLCHYFWLGQLCLPGENRTLKQERFWTRNGPSLPFGGSVCTRLVTLRSSIIVSKCSFFLFSFAKNSCFPFFPLLFSASVIQVLTRTISRLAGREMILHVNRHWKFCVDNRKELF
jgi:hypothetical protein